MIYIKPSAKSAPPLVMVVQIVAAKIQYVGSKFLPAKW